MKSAVRAVESSLNLRIDNRYVRVDYSITNRPRSPGSFDRYKDEMNRYYNSSRHRSNRRPYSPSPPPSSRRKYELDFIYNESISKFEIQTCYRKNSEQT